MRNLIVSFFLFQSQVFAAGPVNTLTWKQSLELLKENNFDYKSAVLNYQATESLEGVAFGGYLPSITGAVGYNKTSTTLDGATDNSSFYSASLTLSQNLFAGLKDYYKTTQATANTRIAQATFQDTKAQISYTFINAYQSLLSAQENLKLSDSTVKRRQDDLRLVELRFESGRENKGSALLSEAYLAQAKLENLQAKHASELAKTALAQVLGVDVQESTQLVDLVPSSEPLANPQFEALAMETPQYKESYYAVDANIAAVGVARSAFFPSLDVTGSVGRNSPEFFPKNDRWSVGATITIPLFSGGRDYATLKNSVYTRDSAVAQKSSVDQKQISVLQSAYQKYTEAVEKLKVDESFQRALVMQAEIARTQYNNGLMSFTDWDKIEADLIARQKAYVQSKKDRILSEAAWNQARGAGVLE